MIWAFVYPQRRADLDGLVIRTILQEFYPAIKCHFYETVDLNLAKPDPPSFPLDCLLMDDSDGCCYGRSWHEILQFLHTTDYKRTDADAKLEEEQHSSTCAIQNLLCPSPSIVSSTSSTETIISSCEGELLNEEDLDVFEQDYQMVKQVWPRSLQSKLVPFENFSFYARFIVKVYKFFEGKVQERLDREPLRLPQPQTVFFSKIIGISD